MQKYRHVHVEYQCEVAELFSSEEFKANRLTASSFPPHQRTADKSSSTSSKTHEHLHTVPIPGNTEDEWPIYVKLTNGKVYGCDLVVSATGVVPNSDVIKMNCDRDTELKLSEDVGGILVDSDMRSSLGDVYAAGDVCTVQWKDHSAMWFQVS